MKSWRRRRWFEIVLPLVALSVWGCLTPSAMAGAGAEPLRGDEPAMSIADQSEVSAAAASVTLLVLAAVIVGAAALGVRTWQEDRRRVMQRVETLRPRRVIRPTAADDDLACGEDAAALESVPLVG